MATSEHRDPGAEIEAIMQPFYEQGARALEVVKSRRPEKRLPRWRPSRRKYWFHLHRWKRSHFDGIEGPIGYKVTPSADGSCEIELAWECERCPAMCVTKDVVTNNDHGID